MQEYHYEILRLSKKFYQNYPKNKYPELLRKDDRPFDVMTFEILSNLYVCIPFRSDMMHNNGFLFKKSKRSRSHHSGLDFSKIVLLENRKYLSELGVVDKDELEESYINLSKIYYQALKYINDYINHITLKKTLSKEEFKRKYQFTTLSYFHKELCLLELHKNNVHPYIIYENRLYISY